jgi:hypothetical protein
MNNPVRYNDPSGMFLGGFLNPGGNPGAIGSIGGTIIGGIFGGIPGAIVGGFVGGIIGGIFNTDPVGKNNDGPQGTPPPSCNPSLQSCFPNTPPPQPAPSC